MRGWHRVDAVSEVGRIEVGLFDLDLSHDVLACCHEWLDVDERARAARFRHDRDRDRFVARRGQLRERLAQSVGEAPRAVRIAIDARGKPFLLDHPGLHFSVSHSHGQALCAVAVDAAVGCDLEWRNPDLACRAVAARLFAPPETTALANLTEAQWVEGFFNCWTRKEAYVKALGLGLSYPLDAFAVSVAPGEPATLIDAQPGWSLASFEPAPGYQAALVTGTR
ncbi:4'-phosphopantetheinyl transferase family protein [Sphingomonas oligophenolica]|nr:4'-phosphopantetheinyl transferase superfamily protein [Sphingomonas oligophenolica]